MPSRYADERLTRHPLPITGSCRRRSTKIKSMGIVLGSYALSIDLVLCTDPILSRIFPGDFEKGRIPSKAALLASTAFFVVISILCAWICARFAPSRPSKHVLWFFILGEVMGIAAGGPGGAGGGPRGGGL